MLVIAHRGNTVGPDESYENHPKQIDRCISQHAMHVEIDLRIINGYYWLGHDKPTHKIDFGWLHMRCNFLWIHCKNIEALQTLTNHPYTKDLNFFWHDQDEYTMTSRGYIWANIDRPISKPCRAISVLPEINNTSLKDFYGICTDYAEYYIK